MYPFLWDPGAVFDLSMWASAAKNVLTSLKKIKRNRIISLIGCGGNRDQGKRELITKIGLNFSDFIVLADDNPRDERPENIRRDMIKNLNQKDSKKVFNIGEREKAIDFAIKMLEKDDILLIAGKGHEEYQIVKNEKRYFSDHKVVENILGNLWSYGI